MLQIATYKAKLSRLFRDAFGDLTAVLSVSDGTELHVVLHRGEIEQYGLDQAIERAIERCNIAQERVLEPVPDELLQKDYLVKSSIWVDLERIVGGRIKYESYLEEAVMLMEAVIDHENTIEQLKAEIASLKRTLGRE